MPPQNRGFTLIELLIAVAIVAILMAVALPSYRQHVQKSKRSEAQQYMLAVAAKEQQFLVDTRCYVDLATVGVSQPSNVTGAYTLTMTSDQLCSSPAAFTLTLTPNSDQSSESCGTLTINQNGTKTATKGGNAVSGCW